MIIPRFFCWTKMGDEGGQNLEGIIRRKEYERQLGNGIFSWGIGNTLGSNLTKLLNEDKEPTIIFSTMKTKAREIDSSPASVILWLSYVENRGRITPLPDYFFLTSRGTTNGGRTKQRHYALICRSERALSADPIGSILSGNLRNYSSGTTLGSSQVTAIVKYSDDKYFHKHFGHTILFSAQLVPNYFVQLAEPYYLPRHFRHELTEIVRDPSVTRDEWLYWIGRVKYQARKTCANSRGSLTSEA